MRFRPAFALLLAYALTLASVLGALSSASLAGTSHIQLCITSVKDGKPLPVHTNDHGLCCFVAQGVHSPALLPVETVSAQPLLLAGERILPLPFHRISGTETFSSHPRAPPARA